MGFCVIIPSVDWCLNCRVMVEKKIPQCKHAVWAECGKKLSKSDCSSSVCEKKLKCGHSCTLPCREQCHSQVCLKMVELDGISMNCGHPLRGECHLRFAGILIISCPQCMKKHGKICWNFKIRQSGINQSIDLAVGGALMYVSKNLEKSKIQKLVWKSVREYSEYSAGIWSISLIRKSQMRFIMYSAQLSSLIVNPMLTRCDDWSLSY